MALIKTRAIARATVKYILAESASRAIGEECDKRYGARSFAAMTCRGLSAAWPAAVLRPPKWPIRENWAALPAQIRMARIKLPSASTTSRSV